MTHSLWQLPEAATAAVRRTPCPSTPMFARRYHKNGCFPAMRPNFCQFWWIIRRWRVRPRERKVPHGRSINPAEVTNHPDHPTSHPQSANPCNRLLSVSGFRGSDGGG
jgi:hypothetical protein